MPSTKTRRAVPEVTLPEAALALGISWHRAWRLCLTGELTARQNGRRYVVTAASVQAYKRKARAAQKGGGVKNQGSGSLLADAIERERAIARVTGGAREESPLHVLARDPARFVDEHLSLEQQIEVARHLLYDEEVGPVMREEIARRISQEGPHGEE
jgi:hypothetical protein